VQRPRTVNRRAIANHVLNIDVERGADEVIVFLAQVTRLHFQVDIGCPERRLKRLRQLQLRAGRRCVFRVTDAEKGGVGRPTHCDTLFG
jgi:hypothetical protein